MNITPGRSTGITGRRDHFIANANAGGIARNYQSYQSYTKEENSKNDLLINSLGRRFGSEVVVSQSISKYAIKNWFYSTNAPAIG
jgi:hypothetical protein